MLAALSTSGSDIKPNNRGFAVAFVAAMLVGAGGLFGLNHLASGADTPPPKQGCEITRAEDNSTQYSALPDIVAKGGTRVLLLGTSRTKMGMGPEVRNSLGPTTNGALLWASYETMRIILAHWPGQPGDRVIIEASFGTRWRNGLEHWTKRPQAGERLVSSLDPRPIMTALFHIGLRERARTDCRGFPMGDLKPATALQFEHHAVSWRKQIEHAQWHEAVTALDGLRVVVQDALDRGYRVDIWVPPENACVVEATIQKGSGPAREEWLRQVVGMTARTARSGAPPVRVWDFSGYSQISTEPLPRRGAAWRSRYFGDPGHVLRVTGARIARQLAELPVPDDGMGRQLTPIEMDAYLGEQARAHDKYVAREPDAALCVAASGA